MTTETPNSASPLREFTTSGGGRIVQIPLEEFPGLWGFVYLVDVDGCRVLIDSGSGLPDSNMQLEKGIQQAAQVLGWPSAWESLTYIFITHAHIDHFGGLSYVRPRTNALLGVHELDLRILTNYEERLVVISRRLNEFLLEAGVTEEQASSYIQLYQFSKSLFHSVRVDFTYEAAGMKVGPFKLLHVPGHCAGHVVIRLHDILFSGDHIINRISPHQAPERLTLYTGLDHYLQSLDEVERWAGDVRLILGGHKEIITDLPGRVREIRQMHRERLEKVLNLLVEPHTIAEVSHNLFGEVHGYNVLLALEETGAHVEYLYARGRLGIANLAEMESVGRSVPIRYYRLPEIGTPGPGSAAPAGG